MLLSSHGLLTLLFIALRAKLAVAPSLGKSREHQRHCREPLDAGTVRPVVVAKLI